MFVLDVILNYMINPVHFVDYKKLMNMHHINACHGLGVTYVKKSNIYINQLINVFWQYYMKTQ